MRYRLAVRTSCYTDYASALTKHGFSFVSALERVARSPHLRQTNHTPTKRSAPTAASATPRSALPTNKCHSFPDISCFAHVMFLDGCVVEDGNGDVEFG